MFCVCSTAAEPLYSFWLLCGCCSWVILFLTWIMLFPRCRYQRSWTRAYTIGSTDSSIKLAGISTLDDVVDTYQENGIPTQFGLNTTVQVNSYERYAWHLKLLKLLPGSFWKLCSFKPIYFSGVFFWCFYFWCSLFLVFFLNPPINHDGQYDQWNLYFNVTGM